MEIQGITLLAGQGARAILYLLCAVSVIQFAVILERAWRFWRARPPRVGLLEEALAAAFHGTVDAAWLRRLGSARSLPERVLAAALAQVRGRGAALDAAVQAAIARERLALERGLSLLGTIGNNAPFVGLLGTVLGIMTAFADLATGSGGQASRAVMSGISEALVATAVGLLVALPAVAAFNTFHRLLRERTVQAEALAALVQVHVHGARAAAPVPVLGSSSGMAA